MDTIPDTTRRAAWSDTLSAMLVAALLLFNAAAGAALAKELAPLIEAPQAFAESQAGKLTIIDVRRPSEWQETGLPEGAKGVSLHNFLGLVRGDFEADVLAAVGGDRNRPIALICAGGVRSAKAARLLREDGFSQILDIGEGMLGNGRLPGWYARNLPRTPCPDC